jgi:hypothetical protein
MDGVIAAVCSAVWLGILTSISPCPLATNIAAISFIGRRIGRGRMVLLTGLLYTLGRMLAYVGLGMLLVNSILAVPQASYFLQMYMNKILGPVLIVTGMVLLELIRFNAGSCGLSEKAQSRIEALGIWGALFLGIIFALSFCPVSAALFFGSLIPLSIKSGSGLILPGLYGFGTAVPVFVFAVLLAFGAQSVARAFDKLTQFERLARRITGGIFILIGIYYCIRYVFKVF